MADVKESAMSQKNDCKWVRALDSNGNSILISKEDLASVVGGLIGTVTPDKNGLMPSSGFIHRSGVQIPTGGTISDIMTSDMKDGIYQVSGISAADPMKDWGVLTIFGSKFAIFKPLNIKGAIITFTRGATTATWDSPYKFTGVL